MSPAALRPEDLPLLRESTDLECKLAQGADGQGELPKDFWPTYSAMANAQGGLVLLGVREKAGQFSVAGVARPGKLRTELFNNLNNPAKVSVNLLTEADVQELHWEGQVVLAVQVPQASRKQRPVYLNGQPLGHTWRRLHDGDRRCDDETVKRMLAEQMEDSRDTRILEHFGLADLDLDSLHAYRNAFAVQRPGHPWVALDDAAFLNMIGGWREDRATGTSGLTAAGLLMFGRWPALPEVFPLYFVDYQERPADPGSNVRWLDRVVADGSWSGNLYDFFHRVIRKLTADLKVPFVLKDGVRIDDTPVHQALREALVNCLIHADYSDRASVLVTKSPAGFSFRNPGVMRLPTAQALHGGASDCRNRTLHQMFLLINLGERAGSGVPKIRSGWEQAGHTLRLSDSFEPFDQTVLEMRWAPAEGMNTNASAGTPEETPEKTPEKTPEAILGLLRTRPAMTMAELAVALGKSDRAIERAVQKLREQGRLRRVGPNKGGVWEVLP
ncbi:RNA-binding domain-containing protein [Roseateles sp. LKC17W]|uniref:RNA-binding domain-containing protein n=1 Tax=Pelomonas margarita TaxID=3299031 RepID=A0ABW7FDW2_9BURK